MFSSDCVQNRKFGIALLPKGLHTRESQRLHIIKLTKCDIRQLKVRRKYRSLPQLQFLNCFCGPPNHSFQHGQGHFRKIKGIR